MHEVVREVTRDARVAYVDYDPVVVSHARVLLTEPTAASRSAATCAIPPRC